MKNERQRQMQEADQLYERHVKPLESVHQGEYVAVSLQGRTVFASTLLDAVQRGVGAFGKSNSVVFEVGEKAVGKLR